MVRGSVEPQWQLWKVREAAFILMVLNAGIFMASPSGVALTLNGISLLLVMVTVSPLRLISRQASTKLRSRLASPARLPLNHARVLRARRAYFTLSRERSFANMRVTGLLCESLQYTAIGSWMSELAAAPMPYLPIQS